MANSPKIAGMIDNRPIPRTIEIGGTDYRAVAHYGPHASGISTWPASEGPDLPLTAGTEPSIIPRMTREVQGVEMVENQAIYYVDNYSEGDIGTDDFVVIVHVRMGNGVGSQKGIFYLGDGGTTNSIRVLQGAGTSFLMTFGGVAAVRTGMSVGNDYLLYYACDRDFTTGLRNYVYELGSKQYSLVSKLNPTSIGSVTGTDTLALGGALSTIISASYFQSANMFDGTDAGMNAEFANCADDYDRFYSELLI